MLARNMAKLSAMLSCGYAALIETYDLLKVVPLLGQPDIIQKVVFSCTKSG